MNRQYEAQRLDVKAFAEDEGTVDQETPLRSFPRLLLETEGRGADTLVAWAATGELRNAGHVNPEIWLHLQVDTLLPLTCQRCLQPVDVKLEVDRSFRFMADEESAAAQDDESEEDLLALSRAFDLPGLVEDELLMALPLAPFHEVCPEPVKLSAVDPDFDAAAAEKVNPFAVLGQLKPGKPS